MGIEWRGPVPQRNFTVGRDGNVVELIVDHWTVVMFEGAVRRFKDPTSILVNLRSIGVGHEASPAMPPSDELYAASTRLHLEIANRHGLDLSVGTTVLPHHAIVPTECPGTLDLDRIVREAEREDDMSTEDDRKMLKRMYDHLGADSDISGPDVESGQRFKG